MPGAGDGGVRDCAGLSARDAATLACGGESYLVHVNDLEWTYV